jgi:hypothetical protein
VSVECKASVECKESREFRGRLVLGVLVFG